MTRLPALLLAALACSALLPRAWSGQAANRPGVPAPPLDTAALSAIAEVAAAEIQAGKLPGAVIVVGRKEGAVYRQAFGARATVPSREPMTVDTIFDLASLTKPVATATALMKLIESHKLTLDEPVARRWPEFGARGKASITPRQLLTHYSGLRADLDLRAPWSGHGAAVQKIIDERPVNPPGTRYLYSDINFLVLGELIERLSDTPLDIFAAREIFDPLGMSNTGFRPDAALRGRIAPTELSKGRPLRGEPHDPTAFRIGGVAGHAGLFSTADDLAKFARWMLNRGSVLAAGWTPDGRFPAKPVLSETSIAVMTSPQSPLGAAHPRGLGWDLTEPFGRAPAAAPGAYAFGHTGYTGTAMWIDPEADVYVIILTNRVHPYGKGDVSRLRQRVIEIVVRALAPAAHV